MTEEKKFSEQQKWKRNDIWGDSQFVSNETCQSIYVPSCLLEQIQEEARAEERNKTINWFTQSRKFAAANKDFDRVEWYSNIITILQERPFLEERIRLFLEGQKPDKEGQR